MWLTVDFGDRESVCSKTFSPSPRGFFPVVVGFIRRVPVLGSLLNLPGIRSVSNPIFSNIFFSTIKISALWEKEWFGSLGLADVNYYI